MKIPLALCLFSAAAPADGECKKERALAKPEAAFFEKAKGLTKALPAAPKGWEQHPEEVVAPAKLCTDSDPLFKKGAARLSVTTETEYRDPADRSAQMELAIKLSGPTAEEAKAAAELTKKLQKTDGGAATQALLDQQAKAAQAQAERASKAQHTAGLDSAARIRITFNPESESSTGCGQQKTVAALKVEGVPQAFSGACDFASNPQEPEAGILLLFGTWAAKAEGGALTATATYDLKKPHTVVQAMSISITGDGARAEELLKGLDLKALAALVGK